MEKPKTRHVHQIVIAIMLLAICGSVYIYLKQLQNRKPIHLEYSSIEVSTEPQRESSKPVGENRQTVVNSSNDTRALTTSKIANQKLSTSTRGISPYVLPDAYIDPPNHDRSPIWYSQMLTATGFTGPDLRWEVVSGVLPQGMYLTEVSFACIPELPCNLPNETYQVAIKGKPENVGVYIFTVRASSGNQIAERRYVLKAFASP